VGPVETSPSPSRFTRTTSPAFASAAFAAADCPVTSSAIPAENKSVPAPQARSAAARLGAAT